MHKALTLLSLVIGASQGYVRAYHVEPKTANWSGWTHGEDGYVSEVVTCCWDSVVYCELFVGFLGASPVNAFKADVYEVGGGIDPVASNAGELAQKDHAWLKFPLTTEPGYDFAKGKQYEFRFTRSGSDSIQHRTQLCTVYPYGTMRPGVRSP